MSSWPKEAHNLQQGVIPYYPCRLILHKHVLKGNRDIQGSCHIQHDQMWTLLPRKYPVPHPSPGLNHLETPHTLEPKPTTLVSTIVKWRIWFQQDTNRSSQNQGLCLLTPLYTVPSKHYFPNSEATQNVSEVKNTSSYAISKGTESDLTITYIYLPDQISTGPQHHLRLTWLPCTSLLPSNQTI